MREHVSFSTGREPSDELGVSTAGRELGCRTVFRCGRWLGAPVLHPLPAVASARHWIVVPRPHCGTVHPMRPHSFFRVPCSPQLRQCPAHLLQHAMFVHSIWMRIAEGAKCRALANIPAARAWKIREGKIPTHDPSSQVHPNLLFS